MIKIVCDECGSDENVKPISLQTGHVFMGGKHFGQGCDLCEKHYPEPGTNQPKNCEKVAFYWPEGVT